MRKIISALVALSFVLDPAFVAAQAPPPVPALPDTIRVNTQVLNSSTCACAVGFAIYGDSTDVDEWIQVFVAGARYLSTDPTFGWSLTSPTGSLATIPRPIVDAVLTFNSAQTATVVIVGARRPRRLGQFSENRGVAARDINQIVTDVVAAQREAWDKVNGAVVGQPGEVLTPLTAAATRAGKILSFDANGNPLPIPTPSGSGNVSGPGSSTNGDVACWNGTSGGALADCGSAGGGNVVGPASSTSGHVATFGSGTGKLIQDGGPLGPLATATGISASTLTASAAAFGINMLNGTIVPSNAGNALTLTVKTIAGATPSTSDPVWFVFRSATPGSGAISIVEVTAALSITIPSGSTIGCASATPCRLWLNAINNAGTVELAVINNLLISSNAYSIFPLAGWGIVNTTAFGGGANNAQTFYSQTSRSGVPYGPLGFVTYEAGSTLGTSGTWNANPTRVELYRPGVALPGTTIQPVFDASSTAATTTASSLTALTNGFTKTITLSSSANLVLLDFRGTLLLSTTATGGAQLYRTSVATATPGRAINAAPTPGGNFPASLQGMDMPGLLTAVTYGIAGFINTGTISFPPANTGVTFLLQELQT